MSVDPIPDPEPASTPAPVTSEQDESRAPTSPNSSSSDSDTDTDSEAKPATEWLATTRQKRSTAGNRMQSMLANEEPDSDLELLFAEDDDDRGFSDDEAAASDVQMDSSDDEDDNNNNAGGDEDLEGEKELEQQAKDRRAAQRKRKAQDAIPAKFRKKVRIDDSRRSSSVTSSVATSSRAAATPRPQQQPHQPRPKKKSERASWLPSPADLPTRASSRQTTRISKEQLHASMEEREARRLKQLAQQEKKAARLEALKKPPMTQEDRLREADAVEKRNSKSLNRWEEAEKQREEERLAKLAALNNRTLKGPVLTFWSGTRQWDDSAAGKYVVMEEKPKRKREKKEKEPKPEKEPKGKKKDKDKDKTDGEKTGGKEGEATKDGHTAKESNPNEGANSEKKTDSTPSGDAVAAPYTNLKLELAPIDVTQKGDEATAPTPTPDTSASGDATKNESANEVSLAKPSSEAAEGTPTSAITGQATGSPKVMAMPPVAAPSSGLAAPVLPSLSRPTPSSSPAPPADADGDTAMSDVTGGPPTAAPSGVLVAPVLARPASLDTAADTRTSSPALSNNMDGSNTAMANVLAPPSQPPSSPKPAALSITTPMNEQKDASTLVADAPTAATFDTATLTAPAIAADISMTEAPAPDLKPKAPNGDGFKAASTPPTGNETPVDAPQPATAVEGGPESRPNGEAATASGENKSTSSTAIRNTIIYQNFDENAIREKTIQTQILFGRKMNKLPKPSPTPVCVITNLPARYRDPATGLPFHNVAAYREIQRLTKGEYNWSRALGAWAGSGQLAAKGVPERFLNPNGQRSTPKTVAAPPTNTTVNAATATTTPGAPTTTTSTFAVKPGVLGVVQQPPQQAPAPTQTKKQTPTQAQAAPKPNPPTPAQPQNTQTKTPAHAPPSQTTPPVAAIAEAKTNSTMAVTATAKREHAGGDGTATTSHQQQEPPPPAAPTATASAPASAPDPSPQSVTSNTGAAAAK